MTNRRGINKSKLFKLAHKYAKKALSWQSRRLTYQEAFRMGLKEGYASFHCRNAFGSSLKYRNFWQLLDMEVTIEETEPVDVDEIDCSMLGV